MFCEQLEQRQFLYADSLFKRDKVVLEPGKVYEISKPIELHSNQKIIGKSTTNLPIIRYKKDTLMGMFLMPENSYNIRIRNVSFDGLNNTPAIRVSGNSHYVGNVKVSDRTGLATIVSHATNTIIENCTQLTYTQKGFIYGEFTKNLTIRNITTFGNLYENDLRFHDFNGLFLTNIKIDGANPKCHVRWSSLAGLKDNALRIHDGKNAIVNGLTATGNVTFGVMDKDNGGYSDLRSGKLSTYYRKMRMTSQVKASNMKIYGNLILGTNLKFDIQNTKIISWKRGQNISFNARYGPFNQDPKKLTRSVAQGTFKNIDAYYSKVSPGNRNIDGVAKFFSTVKISNDGKLTGWFPGGVFFSKTRFNGVPL